jgi:hypothetical protein
MCTLKDVAVPVDRTVTQKEAEKKLKYKILCVVIQYMWKHAMYGYTGKNWSHRNSNEGFKEKFGGQTRKMFSRFATKDNYTWNITYNMESTAV